MSILLEGTWISHPHPTDGLCDVLPGKANLSQKFRFIPEKDCLHPFFSLAFVLSIKKVSLFSSPLKGKTMSPLSSEALLQAGCLLQTRCHGKRWLCGAKPVSLRSPGSEMQWS